MILHGVTAQLFPGAKVSERIRVRRVAEITGLSIRSVQLMACRGKIPSAAQFGRTWTFNERAVREWVSAKEEEARHRSLPARAATDRFRSQWSFARNMSSREVEEAYERIMWPKGKDNPIYRRRKCKT